MNAAHRTHNGHVKQRNEDACYAGTNLFAVADGLGGHVSGDIASQTVITAVAAFDKPVDPQQAPALLAEMVAHANHALRQRARTEPATRGMGSTLVAVLHADGRWFIANVGDSRCYRLRSGNLEQVTDDHTVGRLVSSADVIPHYAERLSRFLNGRPDGWSPDLAPLDVRPGDRVLLCTDGLSSFVDPGLIADLLGAGQAYEAAQALIDAALAAGGPDNVTVVVVDA